MPGNPEKSIAAFAAAFLLPALVGPLVVRWRHDASLAAPVLHAVLLGVLLALVLAPFLWLATTPPGRAARVAFGLVFGTLLTALLSFHVLTILGWSAWHAPLSAELVVVYIGHLPTLLEVVGLDVGSAAALLTAIWLALCLAQACLARGVLDGLHRVGARVGRRRARVVSLALVAGLAAVYVVTQPLWRTREPVHIALNDDWSQAHLAPVSLFVEYSAGRAAAMPPRGPLPTRPRTLVLVMVDALRRDQMGVYGAPVQNTPFLSRLRDEGRLAVLGPAYATCPVSFCGILGTLGSRSWTGLDRPPLTLPDVLAARGYSTRFFLSGNHTRFALLRPLTARSVDRYVDATAWPDRYANDDRDVLDALAREPLADAPPLFLYIHLMSVHALGVRHEAHRVAQPDTVSLWRGWIDPASQRDAYVRRYHNGIRQADDVIRQVFDVLRRAGRLDDALIVITADHGESLGEDGRFAHGGRPDEARVGIPLLVYGDGRNWPTRPIYSQLDVAPTLLRAIDVPVPETFMGEPLQDPSTRTTVPVGSREWSGVVRATTAGPIFESLPP